MWDARRRPSVFGYIHRLLPGGGGSVQLEAQQLDAIKRVVESLCAEMVDVDAAATVETLFRLFGKERIEQTGLMPLESHFSFAGVTKSRDQAVSLQPIFRQQTICPVAQTNGLFTARDCLQQLRHLH